MMRKALLVAAGSAAILTLAWRHRHKPPGPHFTYFWNGET